MIAEITVPFLNLLKPRHAWIIAKSLENWIHRTLQSDVGERAGSECNRRKPGMGRRTTNTTFLVQNQLN